MSTFSNNSIKLSSGQQPFSASGPKILISSRRWYVGA